MYDSIINCVAQNDAYDFRYIKSKALEMDAVASFAVSALSLGILISAALYQVVRSDGLPL